MQIVASLKCGNKIVLMDDKGEVIDKHRAIANQVTGILHLLYRITDTQNPLLFLLFTKKKII